MWILLQDIGTAFHRSAVETELIARRMTYKTFQ